MSQIPYHAQNNNSLIHSIPVVIWFCFFVWAYVKPRLYLDPGKHAFDPPQGSRSGVHIIMDDNLLDPCNIKGIL